MKVINRQCPQEKLKGVWDQKGTAASKVAQRELWLGPIGALERVTSVAPIRPRKPPYLCCAPISQGLRATPGDIVPRPFRLCGNVGSSSPSGC